MLLKKNYLGYDFVKVGHFELGAKPHGDWKRPTQVRLIHDSFLKAESSTYLVILGSKHQQKNILYVGEYTGSLFKRWFQKHSDGNGLVTWHSDNLDDNINRVLRALLGEDVSKRKDGSPVPDKDQEKLRIILKEMVPQLDDGEAREISLWLTVDPYAEKDAAGQLNISRSIEQNFLDKKDLLLPLNTKGRNCLGESTKSVAKIMELIEQER